MSNSINSVNVFSIDEEKLKFRVNVSFSAPTLNTDKGEYKFLLPIPTSLGNSHEYNSCLISCNGFDAFSTQVDPTWSNGGAFRKVGVIELQLDIPSSQTITTTNTNAAHDKVGVSRIGGFREVISLDCHSVGDAAGNTVLQGSTASWSGRSYSGAILCGNPFGKTLTIINHNPINDEKVFLVSQFLGAGSADQGEYVYSFDITLVPNKP